MINSRLAASFGLTFLICSSAFAEKRPNILWITCEDLSPRLGCYGDDTLPTPNIDALANAGVRYTHAFGVYGVCAPNRHCIIMGMYPTTTGGSHMRTWKPSSAVDEISRRALFEIPLYEATPPPEAKCFSEYLRAEGYFCTNNSKTDYQFQPPVTAWDMNGREAHWRKRPNDDTPFFSVFNFFVTHESGTFKKRSPEVVSPLDVELPPYYPDTPLVRRDIARHYDNVAALDKQVGRVLKELKQDGLEDNTIVFFFSDHGDGLPRAKRWVYDSGIRVPFLVRFPDGKDAGQTSDRLISFVDLAPTVLSLANIKTPSYMQGKAFLGSQTTKPRNYIFAVRDRMDSSPETIRAVRDKRYKYIRNYRPDLPYMGHIPYRNRAAIMQEILRLTDENQLGPKQWQLVDLKKAKEEFYDCELDPHEINNLIDDPKYANKIAELRDQHKKWNLRFEDLGRVTEKELVKKLWPPDGVQPTTDRPKMELSKSPDGSMKISLKCKTDGASIAFRTTSDQRWSLYTNPIKLDVQNDLEILAHRIGFKPSETLKLSADEIRKLAGSAG